MANLFNHFPPDSKVWIYQSDRFLEEKEVDLINHELTAFTNQWQSHGSALKASFSIIHNLFIVIAVDESNYQASGCSIDKSTHLLKSLENRLNVSFFDRSKIAYKTPSGAIQITELKKIGKEDSIGQKINKDSIFFNNTVTNLLDFNTRWEQKASESWLNNYL